MKYEILIYCFGKADKWQYENHLFLSGRHEIMKHQFSGGKVDILLYKSHIENEIMKPRFMFMEVDVWEYETSIFWWKGRHMKVYNLLAVEDVLEKFHLREKYRFWSNDRRENMKHHIIVVRAYLMV